jgi:hypothetical protein
LTAALRREASCAGNPALTYTHLEFNHERVVTSLDRYQPSHSNAFQSTLSGEALRERAPAVFVAGAHERTSPDYTFISTQAVLAALASGGFLPVEARQAARARSPMHARHLIRLRRRAETVRLRDSCLSCSF